MTAFVHAIPTPTVRALQAGGPDANAQLPERVLARGPINPCRHCLRQVPEGAGMLILAHRPFAGVHAYSECGPIFLCADPCEAPPPSSQLPEILRSMPDYLIRGYDASERIVYGTGAIVAPEALMARARDLLEHPRVVQVHVRTAHYNCYLARILPERVTDQREAVSDRKTS